MIKIFFTFALILVLTINLTTFDKSITQSNPANMYLNSKGMGYAFADSGDNKDNQTANNSDNQNGEDNKKSEDNSQSLNQTTSEGEQQSEGNQQSLTENNQNKTEEENQTQSNQEGIDEIDNENNNEKATHQGNQEDANNIENAKQDKTVAAEVNIGSGNAETTSIDNNIEVHTANSTSDTVNVTVDSKTESGPKVVIFNLNSTTIDVANVKYLHIMYDGKSIQPAMDMNAVLHPKSTDTPSYAIIVTQNGAQILVSIPHFSTHTITIDKISKVIPAVPEFPIVMIVMLIAVASMVVSQRIKLIKI